MRHIFLTRRSGHVADGFAEAVNVRDLRAVISSSIEVDRASKIAVILDGLTRSSELKPLKLLWPVVASDQVSLCLFILSDQSLIDNNQVPPIVLSRRTKCYCSLGT